MNKSRREILSQLSNIISKENIDTSEIDQKLFKQIKKHTPQDKASKIKLFKQELEEVSGEFRKVSSMDEAAEEVKKIIQQKDYKSISTSGEKECEHILNILHKGRDAYRIVRASTSSGRKRKERIATVPLALVKASYGVADIGALVFPYDDSRTSYPHFLADTVIALLSDQDLVTDQFELFEKIPEEKAKNMVLVAGPSRTADIEKVLILGAHGPCRLLVLLLSKII